MVFGKKITSELQYKITEVATKLNVNPNWLSAIIDFESAGSFSASKTNSLGYTGLIQFGEASAKDLGTTTAQLRAMTEIQQMDYVYRYFARYKSKITSYIDMYLAVLFPVAVGKSSDFVIEYKGISAQKFTKANPYFDVNKNGEVTVAEIEAQMLKRIPEQYKSEFKKKVKICPTCGQSYS